MQKKILQEGLVCNMYIDASFEKIEKYKDDPEIIIPCRKTKNSAGYDFYCAEDTVIPSYYDNILVDMRNHMISDLGDFHKDFDSWLATQPYTLDQAAGYVKHYDKKITLVPTGIKCKMPPDYFLQLSVRSSLPLKHWLILANSVGIIDADYYNNSDNEGHIFFQLINLLPFPVKIPKGACFGQGILIPYGACASEDEVTATRTGGMGSTNDNTSTGSGN